MNTLRPPPGWRWPDLSGRLLWGGVLLLVLGAVLWLLDGVRTSDGAAVALDPQRPDYRLERFAWDHCSPDGQAQWRLAGASLEHFPDGRSQVQQARLTQQTGLQKTGAGASAASSEGLLTVTAGQARASGTSPRQIDLDEGAQMLWQDSAGQARLQVNTGAMRWDEASQQVSSRAPVQVKAQGQTWTAGGFVYDIRQRQLRLTGAVRAVITP
ncbi:LPS export ABC transporter periplasmic protein LptC [Amphibiibacter pelophylacis]|uniref:LPS export ABC transporter periplasmic protein LptC n=1 Tax=Amphibiibacter pelophylacis TaxID=1799477 RepID=A0ACC6NZB2_9BURK